ncbi:hypothetical protein HG530_007275 [Fusarium avenaceum]|nr:hypothetical protein HG530_007275 [Fusarium avenaceum]
MLEHATGCDALFGIENECLHEKIYAIGTYGAKSHFVPILSAHRMLSRDSVTREFGNARPVVVGRSADKLADKTDLVEIGVAGEVGRTHNKLGKNGADRPDINGTAVMLRVEEQLRGSVPAGDDARGHELVRIGEAARKTKISKLDLAVIGDQQVVRLDITMENKVLVTEPNGAGEHAHPCLDVCGTVTNGLGVANEHLKITAGQILEDEVEVLVL